MKKTVENSPGKIIVMGRMLADMRFQDLIEVFGTLPPTTVLRKTK